MTEALQTIRLEHFNYGRVLGCLRRLLEVLETRDKETVQELLRLILDYMESVPGTIHHPKEDHYLYAALRRRLPSVGPILDELEAEHAETRPLLAALRAAAAAYDGAERSVARLREAGSAYLSFELRHMLREEREVLPYALDALTEEDWRTINQAFAQNRDPLFGAEREAKYKTLYRAILGLTSSALGIDVGDSEREEVLRL